MNRALLSMLFCLAVLVGCNNAPAPQKTTTVSNEPFTVYTVNYPLAYFAERIAGDAARVVFPMAEQGDPAFWQPDGDTIRAYQDADLILLNGASYAQWIPMATLPQSRMVNTSAGFADQYLKTENAIAHQHGPEGPHDHGDVQFTTWMDFTLARQQAEAIAQALAQALPDEAARINERLYALKTDLQTLDDAYKNAFTAIGAQPLLASHPVYGYFARHYNLNLYSLHWEPDVLPGDTEWAALEQLLISHPAQYMLWEDTPLPETQARLEGMGIIIRVAPPCGNRPATGDFLSVLQGGAQG